MLRQPRAGARALARLRPACGPPATTSSCRYHTYRTFLTRPNATRSRRETLQHTLDVGRIRQRAYEHDRDTRAFLAAGAIAGVISIVYLSTRLKKVWAEEKKQKQRAARDGAGAAAAAVEGSPDGSGSIQLDSDLPASSPVSDGGRKVVRHDAEGREVVPTGNSTVPEFPRTIAVPAYSSLHSNGHTNGGTPGAVHEKKNKEEEDTIPSVTGPTLVVPPTLESDTEYTLVGVGTRTVSFLGIQVYVLGLYIATADIAELQARLVKKINPIASTLVSTEKDALREKLLDPAESEALWGELLGAGVPARSCVRICPVRDTDFHHLRDGLVRSITANAGSEAMADEGFAESIKQFRRLFNRGKVPQRRELLMLRGAGGGLTVVYDEGKSWGRELIGTVDDERLSRALWMNYLCGWKVASEEARRSIVDGVMGFVERPVGTVAAQVV